MRIVSGKFKGKIIRNPTDKTTRPLKDRVRESIFNILEHSKNEKIDLKGKIVLDMFSGSGSFGIECLSRGAKHVYFLENYKNVINILKTNIEELKLSNFITIYEKNAYDILKTDIKNHNIDLVFIDPPFKDKYLHNLLRNIKKQDLVDKNTLVIFHRKKKTIDKFNKDFVVLREQSYGLSKIVFGKFLF